MEARQLKRLALLSVFLALPVLAAEVGVGEFWDMICHDTESDTSPKCTYSVNGSGNGQVTCDGTTFTFLDDVDCTACIESADIAIGAVSANELASTTVSPASYTNTDLTVDQDGRITAASSGGAGYTDEQAQDAVGAMLTDSLTIDFSYVDATPVVTADIRTDSVKTHMLEAINGRTDEYCATAEFSGGPNDKIQWQPCGSSGGGFDVLASGTNTGQTLNVSVGSVLEASGGGIIRATELIGASSTTAAVDLDTAEVAGILPAAMVAAPGSDTQVVRNIGGALYGDSNLTFDDGVLSIVGGDGGTVYFTDGAANGIVSFDTAYLKLYASGANSGSAVISNDTTTLASELRGPWIIPTAGSLAPTGTGTITATDGDSATAFFTAGAVEAARLDSTVVLSTEIDTSSELAGILGDETGTGAAVFNTLPLFVGQRDTRCADTASAATVTADGCNIIRFTGSTTIDTINTCDAANDGRELLIECAGAAGAAPLSVAGNLSLASSFTCSASTYLSLLCYGSGPAWIETRRGLLNTTGTLLAPAAAFLGPTTTSQTLSVADSDGSQPNIFLGETGDKGLCVYWDSTNNGTTFYPNCTYNVTQGTAQIYLNTTRERHRNSHLISWAATAASAATDLHTIGGNGTDLVLDPDASGTGDVKVTGGFKVGTSPTNDIQETHRSSVAVDPASIAATSSGTTTVAVTNLSADAACACSPRVDWDDDLILKFCYSTAGNINFVLYNPTAGAIDAASQTVDFLCAE